MRCIFLLQLPYIYIYYNRFYLTAEGTVNGPRLLWTMHTTSQAIFKSWCSCCLKCSGLFLRPRGWGGSPSQSIFVLTGLWDESPRRRGPHAALLEADRGPAVPPGDPLRRTVHCYSCILEPGAELLREWMSQSKRWMSHPCVCFFFIFILPYQEINAWNQTEWEFHFVSHLRDLLRLLNKIGFGTANSCNLSFR